MVVYAWDAVLFDEVGQVQDGLQIGVSQVDEQLTVEQVGGDAQTCGPCGVPELLGGVQEFLS
jgi:hypothetical protein